MNDALLALAAALAADESVSAETRAAALILVRAVQAAQDEDAEDAESFAMSARAGW